MELNYFQVDRPNQLITEGPMEFDSAAKVRSFLMLFPIQTVRLDTKMYLDRPI